MWWCCAARPRDGPVPEMAAFGRAFRLSLRGACDRPCQPFGARGEALLVHREQLPGRAHFTSWEDLNQQARQWCDKVNSTYKKHLRAVPRELFAVERLHLKPLPAWIPEVYRLHQRLVDIEGYVALHTNRYSVPLDWIGRRVEVRETKDKIEIQLDARHLVTHSRIAEAEHQRITAGGAPPAAGPGHPTSRSPSRREGDSGRRARDGRVCRGPETAGPQGA